MTTDARHEADRLLDGIKQRLCEAVDQRAELLTSVSRRIHGHPELGFEETFAHDLLASTCEEAGLRVTRGAFGLPTAFMAEAGTSGSIVAVVCEYDALPGLGHACGHNIIGAAGLGAGLALADLADDVGARVRILGTPAEEGGGGKVAMIDGGAFAECSAAMMVHPAQADLRRINAIAVRQLKAVFRGRAAHAAAAPHEGRNALDAAVLGYTNVAALRQHIRDDERIHGVFTDGGDKPNIVPAHAAQHWYVRSGTLERLAELGQRVARCLEAGAMAAGCEIELEWLDPAYADFATSEVLEDLYVANARAIGRDPLEPTPELNVTGSTDMGNVSHVVPSIHPMIGVSPVDVAIHTPAFAEHAGGPAGDRAVLDGAKSLAMTAADVWLGAGVADALRAGTSPASP